MRVENPSRLAYVTQTTLSVDETLGIIEALRKRFPLIQGPKKNDICYATQNRQEAVKDLLGVEHIELLLVVGSSNSSNSRRLVEVARSAQVAGHLIDDASEIQSSWLTGIKRVGVTAGASAPENLVEEVLQRLRSLGGTVHEKEVIAETVTFPIPPELVRPSVEGSR
jgi:4-hydroxy-3-methylbut-2-enyl diphosphate reductase